MSGTTYAGADNYPATTNTVGMDDPASSATISQTIKDLADRTSFLHKRIAAHAESQCPLEIECTDGLNITISPVYGVVTFDTMPRFIATTTATKLTKKNIDNGAAPLGSATYYIYAAWNGAPLFELSLVAPDVWKLYKSTGTDRALIGIAQTDVSAKFIKHRAGRHYIRYLEPAQVRSPNPAPLGDTVDLTAKLFPEARGVRLGVNGQTTISVISAITPYVAVAPTGTNPLLFRKLILPNNLAFGRVNESVDVPFSAIPGSAKIAYQTDSATSFFEAYLQGVWW
jgi:hypothetical protein